GLLTNRTSSSSSNFWADAAKRSSRPSCAATGRWSTGCAGAGCAWGKARRTLFKPPSCSLLTSCAPFATTDPADSPPARGFGSMTAVLLVAALLLLVAETLTEQSELTQGVMTTMFVIKLKIVAGMLTLSLLLGGTLADQTWALEPAQGAEPGS